ncbi:hypothetical protein PAPHI01_0431 [Pancytospora philotis]|nr:hypothetical protein PAPHI01_0431 [Pancytospora philotis]
MPHMKSAFEGEVIETSRGVDYDYLEVKYETTEYMLKRPYIVVPVSRSGEYGANCTTEAEEGDRRWSSRALNELDISSSEAVPPLYESQESDSSGSSERHDAAPERCLLINYIKEKHVKVDEGILQYEEFADFRVRKDEIVHCEAYIILSPFAIEEERCGDHRLLRIGKKIDTAIQLRGDEVSVVQDGDNFKVYGSGRQLCITGKNLMYRFISKL